MALTRNYKAGAVIFFEGDKGDEIYVLKSGAVTLTYRGIETSNYVTERLKIGDFFGVKSAIGHFKREETAQVKEDATVLVLSPAEFEDLAQKNINLVLKMLKIFSTQLRKIGKQAAALLSTSGEVADPSTSLFKLGEYYFNNKKFDQAMYAFHKYIEHYPNGENVFKAKDLIQQTKSGAASSSEGGMDGIISPEDELADDSSFVTNDDDIFEEGMALITSGNYKEAVDKLSKIDSNAIDKVKYEKANFEISKCYFELENYQKSISSFTNFIKENPKTPQMKLALFYIGKSYKESGDIEKAKNFFKKVAGLPPQEPINEEAKKFLNELES